LPTLAKDRRGWETGFELTICDAAPRRGYAICTEARTGSEFLCAVLASTGILGCPTEPFAKPQRCRAIERRPALFDEILRRRTTPNGVYGFKLFSRQFDNIEGTRWTARAPNLHFVHLERRDLLGQAISYLRALQTDQWTARRQRRAEPRYDGKAIVQVLRLLVQGHARWRLYFASNAIEPLWLVYEEMIADPAAAARAVGRHIGMDEVPEVKLDGLLLDVQRDGASEEWRARFLTEYGDPLHLDHPSGRWRIRLRRFARDHLWNVSRLERLRPGTSSQSGGAR
jgi:LPS sulfotransferase NodH